MTAALIYGPSFHYIDHLTPIASLLSIPLLATDPEVAALIEKYYPNSIVEVETQTSFPHRAAEFASTFFTTLPRPMFEQIFFLPITLGQKKLDSIWIPHGYSDKGKDSPFFEGLKEEKNAFFYSEKMHSSIKQHLPKLEKFLLTGNYRLAYYQHHRSFYREILEKQILTKLTGKGRLFLYAPTWSDAENSSSFKEMIEPVCKQLPEGDRLLIKLHPNLSIQYPGIVEKLRAIYEDHPSILILDHFPPIYPLLEEIDVLFCDRSSIGYDALAFKKPMIFFGKREKDPLHRCGATIDYEKKSELYMLLEQILEHDAFDFSEKREALYHEAFGEEKSLESLKNEITLFCNEIEKEEM